MELIEKGKTTFTGHDTFYCKTLWLKKGYDYVRNGNEFNKESCVELGVGKNMVNAIRHWLKSFGVVDPDYNPTEIGSYIFDEKKGKDPFLEDDGTLFILHYLLLTEKYASIYPIIFNDFRKLYPEFSLRELESYLEYKDINVNKTTLKKDFGAFVHNYLSTKRQKDNIEDSFSGIFCEMNFLKEIDKEKYVLQLPKNANIPREIILFAILDSYDQLSVSFKSLVQDKNSLCNVFMLSQSRLHDILTDLDQNFKGIHYSNNSGVRELQFEEKLEPLNALNLYYEN